MSDPLWEQAGRLHASRLFKTTSTEHAYAVILCGHELQVGPVTALANIAVISGKPALGAALVGALIQRSGRYFYQVREMSDQGVSIDFYEIRRNVVQMDEGHKLGTSTFTLDDARKAGLAGTQTWKSYPRNLLLARALTNGARWFTPSVFAGAVYDPTELGGLDVTSDATSATTSVATGNGVPTLEGLLDRYGADAIVAATGGGIPATAEEVAAVAAQLEAQASPGEVGAKEVPA